MMWSYSIFAAACAAVAVTADVSLSSSASSLLQMDAERALKWGDNGERFYTLIAATDYLEESGIGVETSGEGIENVGWFDPGDFVTYPITLPVEGLYVFHARVASPDGKGGFELSNAETGEVYATFGNFPPTQDWKSYDTIQADIVIPTSGSIVLKLTALSDGWNLLWLSMDKLDEPTAAPSALPTVAPTPGPTVSPTPAPTASPTVAPTMAPTVTPTASPTASPTTAMPTMPPVPVPTASPTVPPTMAPTTSPTVPPTMAPTVSPTMSPTVSPTMAPTVAPTMAPTVSPTMAPTIEPHFELIAAADWEDSFGGIGEEISSEGIPNVAYLDAGSWMTYEVEFEMTMEYKVSVRIASPFGDGGVEFYNFDTQEMYGSISSFPATGDWQAYQTVSTTMTLPAGEWDLQIVSLSSGWNFLWIAIEKA